MIRKIKLRIFIAIAAALAAVALQSQGLKMPKLIEGPEGITIAVPRNFPRPVAVNEGEQKILSFNIQPHEKSPRFIHFFELISSPAQIEFLKRIPKEGYRLGSSQAEKISLLSHPAELKTAELEITRACGSRENTRLYAAQYCCDARGRFICLLTFTMRKKEFLKIAESIRCCSGK